MDGLTLMRRAGERIMIGNDVVLTVVKTGKSQCRVNIVAPPDVVIMREEVYLREKEAMIKEDER